MVEDIRNKILQHDPSKAPGDNDDRSQAAVLVPLIADPREPRLVFTERAGSLSSHGGEVSFPGGKVDQTDSSLTFTALRENEEELGLAPSRIEVLGELRPFVSKYGLLVTPVVGLLPPGLTYEPNPAEIASVFEVPLRWFSDASPTRIDQVERHGEAHTIEVFDFEGYEIWGLTAIIVAEFLRVIKR